MSTRSLMMVKGRIAPSLKERNPSSKEMKSGAFTKSGLLAASLAIQKMRRNVRAPTNSDPQTLNPDKFQDLMSTDLTSGFEESSECFEGICRKSSAIVDSRHCCIYVFHEQEQHLVTYMKDTDGKDIQIIKPIDRGITGFVLMEEKGINIADVRDSKYWSDDIDNSENWGTKSYLGWPLRDTMDGTCVGVLEFYDKIDDKSTGTFSVADEQMAQILAFQVSRAIVHYRQQSLLEVRDKAINIVYQKSVGENDSVAIDDDSVVTTARSSIYSDRLDSIRSRFVIAKQRSAIIVGSSKWKWTGSKGSLLCERDWAYDVFSKSDDELIQHAVEIFEERGLFSCFSIPVSIFMNFCREIIAGYEKAPYHNYYHAFDVMHVCYLLIAKCGADEYLDSFNILSILVGALAHDLGHDGFNNAFHCSTNSELAVVYNGISVLENYSAAYLFRILRKKSCNIFARLSDEEMNKMRSRLIDIILDTDAKNHFILVTRFKHSVDMKQLSRGLLSSMLLHVSDVSNPTRPGVISRKWAFAVQEEFFRQGDKEKECNLPISPFMDRSFENLPRMQGAFIDALVGPIFNQLAELFPSVKFQCGRHLQINRSFWKCMQNKSITTSEGIIAYLKTRENGDFDEDDDETGGRVSIISTGSDDSPIPGIPAEARQSVRMEKGKRFSMIPISEMHPSLDDSLIDLSNNEDIESGIQLPSAKESFQEKYQRQSFQVVLSAKRDSMTLALNSPITQSIMMIATIFSLVASDLKLVVGHKDTDIYVDIVILVVFLMFVVELIVSIICDPKYKKFFLWLDLAAITSLLFEMDFLLQLTSSTSEDLAIAKAGRAAKVGARAGRLAKIFRIVRLIKVLKVLKWFMRGKQTSFEQNEDINNEDSDKDIDMKMSIVGSKMTESITKKVILAVLFMLVAFSLLDTNFVPDGREIQLDALARNPESQLLREILFEAHDNLIRLVGVGPTFEMTNRIEELRDVEIMTIASKSDQSVLASFDLSAEVSTAAILSLATTFIVTALLGILSLLFTSDAYKIMIRPIEKMKAAVQRLSQNPLQHLEDIKKFKGYNKNKNESEIDLLEKAIKKMASLLQVGFGPDGAEIISKSIGHMGELVPMTSGTKVHAIFCFCRIRDYTFATEYLQEDITLFINSLAQITHGRAVESGGAPNKNNGEAFFLVWKLNSEKGERVQLQKELFDNVLCTIQNIVEDIKKMGSMFDFITKEGILDGKSGTEENWRTYKICMTFGLHVGWAIEGSIGSKIKVDASYISPHVCLTTQIERATAIYNVPILVTGDLMSSLSGNLQTTCRPVDKLIFKGCDEPTILYHQDIQPFFHLKEKPLDYDSLLLSTTWKGEEELVNSGVDFSEITKILENDDRFVLREVYDRAFYAYLDGEWDKSKILFHLWLKKFPGDVLAQSLIKYLISCNFKCPSNWDGHRKI